MKKLLLLGALSIAAVATTAFDANAWFLACCRNNCCNKCTTTLSCRPYNAFSPCCFGNICCDGCMPINMGGGCCQQQRAPSCFNGSYGPGCCTNNGCCDYGCLPAPGTFASAPMGQMAPGALATVPGNPTPLQIPVNPTQPMVPTGPGPQFVGPNPQVMNPMSYMVPMQPMQMQPMQMQPMYGYPPVQPIAYQQSIYNPYYYPQTPMSNYGPVQAPAYWYGR
ncbi:MAG TPA: hypothetical protein VE988_26075 [Gemmataceae bacterium]|nr:hypothetical protein [Gemmataceae bacterium]